MGGGGGGGRCCLVIVLGVADSMVMKNAIEMLKKSAGWLRGLGGSYGVVHYCCKRRVIKHKLIDISYDGVLCRCRKLFHMVLCCVDVKD